MRTAQTPLLIICLLLFSHLAKAQVVINEYSAANRNTISNSGSYPDWIELYNAGSTSVNLGGYYLSDRENNPDKWEFPEGVSLAPGEHLLVFADGKNEYSGGAYHTNFKLTQTTGNDQVVLADPQGNILEVHYFAPPNLKDNSYGRVSDGSTEWGVFTTPTPGEANTTNSYHHYSAKPEMSPQAGFYSGSVSVVLSTTEPNAEIRYTTDGSEPNQNSTLYTGPITLTETTVLRARSFSADGNVLDGHIETNTYFIDDEHSIYVISIAGNNIMNLMNGDWDAEPIGSFELFDPEGNFLEDAVGEYNKHGNDSWAYDQRGIDYITRDQFGYNNAIHQQIFDITDRDKFQRLILKAAANDNYPFEEGGAHIRDAYVHELSQRAGLELDERSYEPCVLYVNGQYWGIYEIREKVDDHDFTKYYYDQGRKWIDFIKTWGTTWEEYGSWDDWYDLYDFILANDMSNPENYDYVKSQLNVTSLVDYMIINTHVVCKDWLIWNTAWWRGRKPTGQAKRWRYTLWDMDATFGHYINYTGIPDPSPYADPCYNEPGLVDDPEGHTEMLQALLENQDFHDLYVNRYADMLNTYFTCDSMISILDELLDRIEPEMPRHIQRWGGSMSEWQQNVQELKDFIYTRCTVLNEGISDCYEVEGPYALSVAISPSDSPNEVQVNTIVPEAYPFVGNYFAGVNLQLTALPAEEWVFDHWEVANNAFSPDEFSEAIELAFETGDTLTAYFEPDIPCLLPGNLTLSDTTSNSATISWDGSGTNAISYTIRYRPAGSSQWIELSYQGSEITLFGLQFCTEYEFQLSSVCQSGSSEPMSLQFSTSCISGTEEPAPPPFAMGVYPNPFKEAFYVQFSPCLQPSACGGQGNETLHNAQLSLLNLNGQTLWQRQLGQLSASQSYEWKVQPETALPEGMYLLQLRSDEGVMVVKVGRL